ncbi:MAG: rod shape-determining protein MreD [Coriobacteriia bacterium]|nr:rod shape-determining protein MreD [Coriobacteriia bacterium]
MRQESSIVSVAIGMLVAFFLQVGFSTNLAIASVAADIALCFAVVNAMRVSQPAAVLCAFILGATVDLACGTPLGVRAFAYCLVAFAINPLSTMPILSSTLTRFIAVAVMVFCGEFLIALLMSTIGLDNNLTHTVANRVLPAGLYDSVIAFIMLPYARLSASGSSALPSIRSLSGRSAAQLKDKLPPL